MTLCLASFARKDKYIIAICDTMISSDDWSGDKMALKARPLPNDWCVMTAGDQSPATPILESVVASLATTSDKSLSSTVACFQQAFSEQLQSRIRQILMPYGMTLENYHQIGPALGPNFQKILFEMSTASIAATFLVFGYDDKKRPHIFTIKDKGEVEYFDLSGFWAVGCGQTAALGSLFSKNHSRWNPYKLVLLNICEAKFAAEAAPGVGQGSFVVVIHPDGSHLTLYDIEPVRKAYERARRRPVTKTQKNAVEALLKNLTPERGPQKKIKEEQSVKQLAETTKSSNEAKQDLPVQ